MARSFYGKTGVDFKDNLSDNLDGLKSIIQEAAYAAVDRGASIIRDRMVELCPRSPGAVGHGTDGSHMQDRISYAVHQSPEGAYARIGPDMITNPYAPHVEFGPNGRPFARPAIDESREEVHEAMRAELEKFLGSGIAASTSVRFRRFA